MLACARIGAIHSVVFGGFASGQPGEPHRRCRAEGGRQRRRRQPRAARSSPTSRCSTRRSGWRAHKPGKVLLVDRGLAPMDARRRPRRTTTRRCASAISTPRCRAPGSTPRTPSYTLYTSGTTGQPKGVQRDTGGYAVALAASMKHIFCGQPGETYFSTSDIGWVVGHSYIVYGPLIAGMATIMYEGLPIRPDAGIWWQPGREVQGDGDVHRADRDPRAEEAGSGVPAQARPVVAARAVPRRRAARRADRALDRRGARQADHRQLLADRERLADPDDRQRRRADGRASSAARACRCTATTCSWSTRRPARTSTGAGPEGRGRHRGADAAGLHADGLARRRALRQDLLGRASRAGSVYSTFDWGIRDADGYYFILGRTDDVINVAGHRLGTREIEESISSHPNVAEVAVVGVADAAEGPGGDGLRHRQGCAARSATPAARLQARGRHHEDGRRPARRRWRGRRACTSSPRCRRRAPASCCAARSRPSARAAIPAT